MLARAPGDVAHANVAQVTVPRRQRGSPRPAWGNGAVCPATPGANAHGVPRTAVTSANGAPSRPAGRGTELPHIGPADPRLRLSAGWREHTEQHGLQPHSAREHRQAVTDISATESFCAESHVTPPSRLPRIRRFYVRALTIDRPRSVTAGVLRPGSAASSSWVGRPVAPAADSTRSLRGRLPRREAGRLGMGPAVVPGQDPA